MSQKTKDAIVRREQRKAGPPSPPSRSHESKPKSEPKSEPAQGQ
jgi:hypothetical protein